MIRTIYECDHCKCDVNVEVPYHITLHLKNDSGIARKETPHFVQKIQGIKHFCNASCTANYFCTLLERYKAERTLQNSAAENTINKQF